MLEVETCGVPDFDVDAEWEPLKARASTGQPEWEIRNVQVD
jgi:hypothetical protein